MSRQGRGRSSRAVGLCAPIPLRDTLALLLMQESAAFSQSGMSIRELFVVPRHLGGMYDVIVIGTRVAGASTAMLLARGGLNVLAVDRARFPSDTLSTHQVQVQGAARLARWGLLDRVEAAGTPATRRVRFDAGPVVLEGGWPAVDDVDALYSPRRTVLDKLLVDAARRAGAEVREHCAVETRRSPICAGSRSARCAAASMRRARSW